MSEYFFRVKKLKGAGIIKKAARHNKRQIQRELGADSHIATHLMALNERLYGPETADGVAELAARLMREAGIVKLRKDAVLGIEALFSLPLNIGYRKEKYFRDCVKWFIKVYGGVLLSADIHRDETTQHCHVLMLPLIDGRLQGNKAFGKKPEHHARVTAFFDDVAASYGLQRPATKLQGKDKDECAELVVRTLRATNDPALQSASWQSIRQSIETDPNPYMLELGLSAKTKTEKPMRTMAQIFTSKGKGLKAIAFADKELCEA